MYCHCTCEQDLGSQECCKSFLREHLIVEGADSAEYHTPRLVIPINHRVKMLTGKLTSRPGKI